MDHLFLELFGEIVLKIDRALQKRVRSAIPDFDALWNHPAETLAQRQVVIGPLRQYAVATVLGLVAGIVFFGVIAICALGPRFGRPAVWGPGERAFIVVGFIASPLIAFILFFRRLRGGEMILRPDGVVLRYRQQFIYCPWALFQAGGEPWQLNGNRLVLPVWPPAVEEIALGDGKIVRATGRRVRNCLWYFRTKSEHEAVLVNWYEVRLKDLGELLLHLGHSLGPSPGTTRSEVSERRVGARRRPGVRYETLNLEHYLLLFFADSLLAIDRFLQKRASRAIPDFDQLWEQPATVLKDREIVIGPMRRYAVATALGLCAGFAISCGFLLSDLGSPRFRPIPQRPLHEQVVAYLGLFAPPVLCIGILWFVLRGGRMILRADGVLMRYRRRVVHCPWALFQADGEPWKRDRSRLVLPLWSLAVADVSLAKGDAIRVMGQDVRSKQFYFLSDHEAVIADLYAVRLNDVGELLLHLGHALGPASPSP